MTHVAVWVDGQEVTCDTLGDLNISGGRSDRLSEADPATLGLRFPAWPTHLPVPQWGSTIHVAGWLPDDLAATRAALFSGHVTDVAIEDGAVSLVAADPKRRLGGVSCGDEPWPGEWVMQRIERVWDVAGREAGRPAWMGASLADQMPYGFPHNGWVIPRDIDRVAASDVLGDYLAPLGFSLDYQPSSLYPEPRAPGEWDARAIMRTSLVPGPHWLWVRGLPTPVVRDCFIASEDPIPRLWQNTTQVVNEWSVGHRTLPTLESPDEWPERNSTTAAPLVERLKYGHRRAHWTTEFSDTYVGQPTNTAPQLGAAWLARTRYPAWLRDNTTVVLNQDTITRGGLPGAREAWLLAVAGAGVAGRYSLWESFAESTADAGGRYIWYVESTGIRWTPTGWEITVALTPAPAYDGSLTPIDPRNSWTKLVRAHTTWADVVATHTTWADVVATPHPHLVADVPQPEEAPAWA